MVGCGRGVVHPSSTTHTAGTEDNLATGTAVAAAVAPSPAVAGGPTLADGQYWLVLKTSLGHDESGQMCGVALRLLFPMTLTQRDRTFIASYDRTMPFLPFYAALPNDLTLRFAADGDRVTGTIAAGYTYFEIHAPGDVRSSALLISAHPVHGCLYHCEPQPAAFTGIGALSGRLAGAFDAYLYALFSYGGPLTCPTVTSGIAWSLEPR